jgi:hypothetical protein
MLWEKVLELQVIHVNEVVFGYDDAIQLTIDDCYEILTDFLDIG